MRVIVISTLRDFWEKHPQAETPLRAWFADASRAEWKTPVGGGVNPRKYGAEKANLQVVSAEMPRSQPCHSVSPLRYVKGALRQAA